MLANLSEKGKLSDELLLDILRRGEIVPDNLDIEEELARESRRPLTPQKPVVIQQNPVPNTQEQDTNTELD